MKEEMTQIPAGYKMTEVGVIPEDWEVASFYQLIYSVEAGVSVNSVTKEEDVFAHEYSILKTSCVFNGKFLPEENKKIVPQDIHRAKINPSANTIIISRMNTPLLVGECGYVNQNYPYLFLPDRLWIIRFNDNMPTSAIWLSSLLSFGAINRALKESSTGTSASMKNISKTSLLSFRIPLPPLAEQTAIASSLSDADALIGSLERLIAKNRLVQQGAMQELLTGKRRLAGFVVGATGYKQTEVGVIPEDWAIGKLESITDPRRPISYGIVQTGQSISSGIKCLRVIDINNGKINQSDLITTSKYISDAYGRTILKAGDIVMPLRGKVGDAAIVDENLVGCNLTRGVALIAILSTYNSNYCKYYISSPASRIRLEQLMNGSALQEIPIATLRGYTIPLPPLTEQSAIASVLSDMDAEISALENKLVKARQIKQGMMNNLLTGKIRLPF